jgi:ABC-type multidrug transport system ATPase subunit
MPIQLPGLSVERQVRYAAWLAGVPRGDTPALAQRALAATDLTDLSDRDATRLSGGQAARLGIACALAPTPRYLLLDEPTASLDPLSRRSVTSVLRTLSENGVRIVASSHTASDVGDPFTRLIVLDQGTVVFDASVETFLTGDHHVPVVADLAQALRER